MKLKTLCFITTLFFSCISFNLYAQSEIKITGKPCKGAMLLANATGGTLIRLEWKLNGKTIVTDSGSSNVGVTVAGGNGEGNGADQLDDPNGVFVDRHGNLWVADTRNARIQKFLQGHKKGITIGADLPNAPTFPTNLFVCYDGSVYVADYFESRVKRLEKDGKKWIDVAGQNDEMKLTRAVWVDKKGNVFATDCRHSRVLKYAPHSSVGKVVAGGNGYGSALNQLARPASVVVDDNENLYITDEGNNRVVKWAPNAKSGVVVAGNGLNNLIMGTINNPLYTSVGHGSGFNSNSQSTYLYISDNNDRVQLWLEGTSTSTTIAGGNGRGSDSVQLNRPFANFISDHYLFVADHDNARIQRFDLNGNIALQISATKPGNYSVTATLSNGKVLTSSNFYVGEVCDESLIASTRNNSDMVVARNQTHTLIYPNPAKNTITINFSSQQNSKYILELTELNGKILLHKEIYAVKGVNNTTLDVSRFAKGVYFVNVINSNKEKQSVTLNKE
jgi:sugar lactone lactonase YvrE